MWPGFMVDYIKTANCTSHTKICVITRLITQKITELCSFGDADGEEKRHTFSPLSRGALPSPCPLLCCWCAVHLQTPLNHVFSAGAYELVL